jgi:hypothetical protein
MFLAKIMIIRFTSLLMLFFLQHCTTRKVKSLNTIHILANRIHYPSMCFKADPPVSTTQGVSINIGHLRALEAHSEFI